MEQKLIIVARSDIQDMNPGKMAAQCSHATSNFHDMFENKKTSEFCNPSINICEEYYEEEYRAWLAQAGTFGTTYIQQAVLSDIKDMIAEVSQSVVPCGLVVDPTYPWRNWYGDGFTSSEITCGWFFISSATCDEVREKIKGLGILHP